MTRNCFNVMRKIASITKCANPLFTFLANQSPDPTNIPTPPTPKPQAQKPRPTPMRPGTVHTPTGVIRSSRNALATPTVSTASPTNIEQLKRSLTTTATEAQNRVNAADPRWTNYSKEAPEGAGIGWKATPSRPEINKCNLSVGTALCGGYGKDMLRTESGTLMNANSIYEMLAGNAAPPKGFRVHPLTQEQARVVPGAISAISGERQGHVGITSGRGTSYSAAEDRGMIDNNFAFRPDGKAYRYGILVPDSVKGGDVRNMINSYMNK